MKSRERRKPGPDPRPMPAQIPDTPENVAKALMDILYLRDREWQYMKEARKEDSNDELRDDDIEGYNDSE